jgi:hypothetical protein
MSITYYKMRNFFPAFTWTITPLMAQDQSVKAWLGRRFLDNKRWLIPYTISHVSLPLAESSLIVVLTCTLGGFLCRGSINIHAVVTSTRVFYHQTPRFASAPPKADRGCHSVFRKALCLLSAAFLEKIMRVLLVAKYYFHRSWTSFPIRCVEKEVFILWNIPVW